MPWVILGISLGGLTASGQDPRPEVPAVNHAVLFAATAATGPRTSPFDPPAKDAFVADGGSGLDTGCTFDNDPEAPLRIDVEIDRFVGDVDAGGYLVDPADLIAKGVVPATVEILMPAYDIDFNGAPPPERDEVRLNGESLGYMTGDNNVWKLNSFTVDVRKIKFPAAPAPGTSVTPAVNRIQVDIDLLSSGRWCMSVDWVAFLIPLQGPTAVNLTVATGNRIRVNDLASNDRIDTIYDETFDPDCNLTLSGYDFATHPFSGVASQEAVLHAQLTPCPAGSIATPEVQVNWSIDGTSLQGIEPTWSALEGDIHVGMPDAVGSYTVNFEFVVNGGTPRTISRKLLVTKAAPLLAAPRLSWYERAIDWTSGTSASSSDTVFVARLLGGLYAFGSANWRYGYFFDPKCSWQQLIAEPITCDASDCYVFSEVLENTAKTLGIGGLSEVVVDPPYAFLTSKSPSLDPAFPGSAKELGTSTYDRYLFSSHSLRHFDGLYFDATFMGVYLTDDEFIDYHLDGAWGIDASLVSYRTTVEGARLYTLPGESYPGAGWGNYAYVEPVTTPSPSPGPSKLLGPGAFAAAASSEPRFTGVARYRDIDANADGFAEQLEAEVEIDLPTDGNYVVTAALVREGNPVASRPVFESMLETRAALAGVAGINTVSLLFSGEQILRSGLDGPYALRLFLHGLGAANNATADLVTPPFDHLTFAELGASLASVTDAPRDLDGDGLYDEIRVTVSLGVRTPGNYGVLGTLRKDGSTLVTAMTQGTLPDGTQTATLVFSGHVVRRRGLDGPFAGVVTLTDADDHTLDSIEFTSGAYRANGFAALVLPSAPWQEQALDTNGNALYDVLRISQAFDCVEAGDFVASGKLTTPTGTTGLFVDVPVTLVRGANTVVWDFPGPLIRAQALDGPYVLDVALRDAATGRDRDRFRLPQSTQAYRAVDFDLTAGAAAISLTGKSTDRGIDTNGNGRFDQLRVDVEVLVPGTATYDWSARLVDATGKEIGFSSGRGQITKGLGSIQLLYGGQAIGKNAVSGPYFVRGLLLFAAGQGSLLATDVATTQAYRFGQFEGAPAMGDVDGDSDIDIDDLALVNAARNTPSLGQDDRRDVDGDGKITALDSRKLVTLFTRPRGARN